MQTWFLYLCSVVAWGYGHPVVGARVTVGPSTQHPRQSGQPVKGGWADDEWALRIGRDTDLAWKVFRPLTCWLCPVVFLGGNTRAT